MRIVVGISGASGVILGVRLLETLRRLDVETHLVMSRWAKATLALESDIDPQNVEQLATVCYQEGDQAAAISSGSFKTDGMVIAPCSMKTLAGIRHGFAADLIGRAADVVLKERRKLLLVARESPLSEIHLENMLGLSRMGVVIVPPTLSFYQRPTTIDDMIDHVIARTLDHFDLEMPHAVRWQGTAAAKRAADPNAAQVHEFSADSAEARPDFAATETLPEPVRAFFDGGNLPDKLGTAAELISLDANHWPRAALVGPGELLAVSADELRLGLWPDSRTASNLRRARQASLQIVLDNAFFQIRFRVEPLEPVSSAKLACFSLRPTGVHVYRVDYARLDSGIHYSLDDPQLAIDRWQDQLSALRDCERAP